MKMNKSIEVRFREGVEALKKALEIVPDDAKVIGISDWQGSYMNERKEATGVKFSWEEEV